MKITDLECAIAVLAVHREARNWTDEAVAADLLTQLGLDARAEAANARPVVDPNMVTEDQVTAFEAAAKEAADRAKAARDQLTAQENAGAAAPKRDFDQAGLRAWGKALVQTGTERLDLGMVRLGKKTLEEAKALQESPAQACDRSRFKGVAFAERPGRPLSEPQRQRRTEHESNATARRAERRYGAPRD